MEAEVSEAKTWASGAPTGPLIGLQEEWKLFLIHVMDQLDQLNGMEPD